MWGFIVSKYGRRCLQTCLDVVDFADALLLGGYLFKSKNSCSQRLLLRSPAATALPTLIKEPLQESAESGTRLSDNTHLFQNFTH